ncbi:nitroreductase [Bacteroidia bacterium]|nr:nitroreductase [Bacteroidia bacterium]
MNIQESIQKRRSVRTYTGQSLKREHITALKQFISQLPPFHNIKARIEHLSVFSGEKPIKLGTYGKISGAKDFIVLIYENIPFAEAAAAYQFEQVILFCTELGLATCWLGAAFNSNDFKKHVQLNKNETLKIVSPVGYPAEKQRFLERLVRVDKIHNSRKPFGELFFYQNFDTPLTEETAGIYFIPLSMVRLAPSGHNKQEWRIIKNDNVFHFYKNPCSPFDNIDIGIALCHFIETCKEINVQIKLEFLTDYPISNNLQYMVSCIVG